MIPLAMIIGLALHKSASSKTVTGIWESLLAEFGTEVNVLVDASMDDFRASSGFNLDASVVEAIEAFREGKVLVIPGGGGKYGVIALNAKGSEEAKEKGGEMELEEATGRGQKRQLSLIDF